MRVSPNQQDGVHDGHKKLSDFVEVLARVYEIVEECLKSLEVLVVLIGFLLSDLHFFLELRSCRSPRLNSRNSTDFNAKCSDES